MIRLVTITPDNWRLGLSVREDQYDYVSDSSGILARAYAYRDNRSQAFVIYDDGLYKVQVGAFQFLANAIKMEERLRNYRYNTFITV